MVVTISLNGFVGDQMGYNFEKLSISDSAIIKQ